MLRARPIHFTSRQQEWEKLLAALGMVKTEDRGDSLEYDAGSGRLALRRVAPGSPQDGRTEFGVEVGDPEEFARRTNEAAAAEGDAGTQLTQAEMAAADGTASCRITGHDGFTFQADKAEDLVAGTGADPALAVVAVWFSSDATAAAATLRHIGGRPRPVPDNDNTADFTTKNGGVLIARVSDGPSHSGLGFEYAGDLETLRDRLSAAGYETRITEEAFGRTLHVPNPDEGSPSLYQPGLWVAGRQPADS